MDIVDRIRKVEDGHLLAPAFISAPCGLLPDTKVYVSAQVHLDGDSPASGVTVVVRPYPPSPGRHALLTCSLRCRPGALPDLLRAIATKGVNIVNAVSAEVHDKGEVEVCLVLDWSSSPYRDRGLSTAKQLKKYRDHLAVFPVTSARYVELYEEIYQACRATLIRGTNHLPKLIIDEFADPSGLQFFDAVTVDKGSAVPLSKANAGGKEGEGTYPVSLPVARISLPNGLIAKLKLCLDEDVLEKLQYTLTADVRTRTLRAFFPLPTVDRTFVHAGFFHTDAPGTFAMILRPLEQGGIRIMNNLVRTLGNNETVLEVVLSIPNQLFRDSPLRCGPVKASRTSGVPSGKDMIHWLAQWMVEHVDPAEDPLFTKCNLRVGRPLFPKPPGKDAEVKVAVVDVIRDRGIQPGSKSRNGTGPVSSQPEPKPASIAERVRSLVRQRPVTGVSLREIKEEIEGIDAAYLNSLLYRQAHGKKLRYAGGRYYPA
jgi:hypothetical protein